MLYPKIPLAQSIIKICSAKGIKNVVISPGSRNAPLTIGFVSNPDFNCYSIVDERCAAFFALGMAQQNKTAVLLVCTSGSALLNYYPAFAEAFYSQIPIIVLSADRPKNRIDLGDGQTIRQENVFSNHSHFNANLSEIASPENDLLINEAINAAITNKGPVHINAPFSEPLYQTTNDYSVEVTIKEIDQCFASLLSTELELYAGVWNSAKKILILIGENQPNTIEASVLEFLANCSSVVVFTEKTSNIHHESFIHNIDAVITPFTVEDFQSFQPDLLLTFGGMVVSKRIKAFLREYKPQNHWHIDPLRAYDTYNCLTNHIKLLPNTFFNLLIPSLKTVESTYFSNLEAVSKLRQIKHVKYLAKIPFSDLKAFEIITAQLQDDCVLQLGNSSTVRYAQLFSIKPSIEVFCNRGTSGIDGSSSTAIGASVAVSRSTVLITGDVSFFYDSNALWNDYIPNNFKIILINNGGGGIFRILPGHQETPVFNKFFETSHCLTAENLAKMYQFDYHIASDVSSLTKGLTKLFGINSQPTILEVFTPTLENNKILLQYFKELV